MVLGCFGDILEVFWTFVSNIFFFGKNIFPAWREIRPGEQNGKKIENIIEHFFSTTGLAGPDRVLRNENGGTLYVTT